MTSSTFSALQDGMEDLSFQRSAEANSSGDSFMEPDSSRASLDVAGDTTGDTTAETSLTAKSLDSSSSDPNLALLADSLGDLNSLRIQTPVWPANRGNEIDEVLRKGEEVKKNQDGKIKQCLFDIVECKDQELQKLIQEARAKSVARGIAEFDMAPEVVEQVRAELDVQIKSELEKKREVA